jgi:hypothetical protein
MVADCWIDSGSPERGGDDDLAGAFVSTAPASRRRPPT